MRASGDEEGTAPADAPGRVRGGVDVVRERGRDVRAWGRLARAWGRFARACRTRGARFRPVPVAAATLLLLLPLLAPAGPAEAQSSIFADRLFAEGRVGIGIPTGDLGDLADVGPAFGLGVGYRIRERIAFRFDADVELLSEANFDAVDRLVDEGPDVTLYHFRGGVDYLLTEPDRSPLSVTVTGGLGATVFDTDRLLPGFRAPPTGGVRNPRTGEIVTDFAETYFLLSGGVRVGYDLLRRFQVYAGLESFVTFADEDDTAVFTELSGADVGLIETTVSIPISVGARVRF